MTATTLPPPTVKPGIEDDDLYEVIDGQRIGQPPMGVYAVWIAGRLHVRLGYFAEKQNLGRAVPVALFHLPPPINRDRRPDVAFVSYERWAKSKPIPLDDNAWNVVPNLATEVVSPTDKAEEIETKIAEYFQAGVQLVWLVYPKQRKIHVYHSPENIHVLGIHDELDGGNVVPGFRLALAELFANGTENGAAS